MEDHQTGVSQHAPMGLATLVGGLSKGIPQNIQVPQNTCELHVQPDDPVEPHVEPTLLNQLYAPSTMEKLMFRSRRETQEGNGSHEIRKRNIIHYVEFIVVNLKFV